MLAMALKDGSELPAVRHAVLQIVLKLGRG